MSGNSRVIFSVYKEVNDESVTDYKKQQLKKSGSNSNLMPKKIISKNRRSSSSLYDEF